MPPSSFDYRKFIQHLAASILGCLTIAILTFWCWRSLFGQPRPSGYSDFPTVLFLSSFGMIGTSASLGFALSSINPKVFNHLLSATLVAGSLFLGWQSYGIWSLKNVYLSPQGKNALAPLALVSGHFIASVLVMIGLATAIAWLRAGSGPGPCEKAIDPGKPLSEEERALRTPLKLCGFVWFVLSFFWVWIMCIVPAFL